MSPGALAALNGERSIEGDPRRGVSDALGPLGTKSNRFVGQTDETKGKLTWFKLRVREHAGPTAHVGLHAHNMLSFGEWQA